MGAASAAAAAGAGAAIAIAPAIPSRSGSHVHCSSARPLARLRALAILPLSVPSLVPSPCPLALPLSLFLPPHVSGTRCSPSPFLPVLPFVRSREGGGQWEGGRGREGGRKSWEEEQQERGLGLDLFSQVHHITHTITASNARSLYILRTRTDTGKHPPPPIALPHINHGHHDRGGRVCKAVREDRGELRQSIKDDDDEDDKRRVSLGLLSSTASQRHDDDDGWRTRRRRRDPDRAQRRDCAR